MQIMMSNLWTNYSFDSFWVNQKSFENSFELAHSCFELDSVNCLELFYSWHAKKPLQQPHSMTLETTLASCGWDFIKQATQISPWENTKMLFFCFCFLNLENHVLVYFALKMGVPSSRVVSRGQTTWPWRFLLVLLFRTCLWTSVLTCAQRK